MLELMETQTTENKGFRSGRPKGVTNLPDEIKLDILANKKLQLVTQADLASKYGVSRKTINQLSEENLSEEAKEKLESFIGKLAKVRDKTVHRIKQRLDNDTFPVNGLANLLNVVNTHYRLENGESTQNISIQSQQTLVIAEAKHLINANPSINIDDERMQKALKDIAGDANMDVEDLIKAVNM